jgi:hypothetical protein
MTSRTTFLSHLFLLCAVVTSKSSLAFIPSTTLSFTTKSVAIPLHQSHDHSTSTSLFFLSPKNKNDESNLNDNEKDDEEEDGSKKKNLTKEIGRSLFISTALAGLTNLGLAVAAPPGYKRIPTQFIAALGDPQTNTGMNAGDWGLWTVDPGPRGVYLRDYEKYINSKDGKAPAGWKFDKEDWWLEEHGLIMEAPDFPLASGKYLVTGGRLVTTVLEIDDKGNWKLEKGSLYDVTHLPCRSARYTPGLGNVEKQGSPLTAKQSDFPVTPGAEMPKVEGCEKLDYAVLFVIGKEAV